MISLPSEIERKFYLDHCWKNIRIHFPNGERQDICNDLIVKDSVAFKESLCSESKFKFGLCEASVFECEVVGVGNIKGASIEVSCEVECEASVEGAEWKADIQKYVYPVPYGTFVVDSCQRQADIVHRRITAYANMTKFSLSEFELNQKHYYGTAIASYTPAQFLFGMENIQTKGYDSNIFDVSSLPSAEYEVQGNRIGTLVNYSASPMWLYTTLTMSAKIWKFDDISYVKSLLDNMFSLELIRGSVEAEQKKFDEYINNLGGYRENSNVWTGLLPSGALCWYADFDHYTRNKMLKTYPQMFYPYFNGKSFYVLVPYTFTVKIYVAATREESALRYTYVSDPYTSDISLKQLTLKSQYSFLKNFRLEFPVHTEDKGVLGNYVYTDMKPDLEAAQYDNQEILNNSVELLGKFGYLTRDGIFKLLDIKQQFGLRPSQTMYPNSNLYPGGVTGGSIFPNDYQSCWYDDDYTKPFGAVYCQFKDSNNNDVQYTLYLDGFDADTDPETYQIYDLSNSQIIRGSTWTTNQIETLCAGVADSIEGVTYMPVDFKGRGLPHVEAGDTFEILTRTGESITTIVLNRTLTGEQTLTDSYKSV